MMGRTVLPCGPSLAMARKNSGLHDLRKQVIARQRAANRKIARHESKGVKLSGTKYDPRRPTENISRYNSAQLRAHLNRLDTFMSRRTQFVADAHGTPIDPKVWKAHVATQRALNKVKRDAFAGVKDVQIPGSSITIGERQKIVSPDRPHAGNPAANPYVLVERKPNSFVNEGAMKKVTRDLQKKLKSDFLAKDLKSDRRVADEMADALNRPDIKAALAKLSDRRFNVLWNFTRFAADLSAPYKMYNETKPGGGGKKAWHQQIIDDNLDSAVELINDVQTLKFRR